jgi:hypothetical protein
MVTKRGPKEQSTKASLIMSLKPSCLSIEELEHRLETALLRPGRAPSEIVEALRFNWESCGCLDILCLCDGQDCVGVCESHCLIHYL